MAGPGLGSILAGLGTGLAEGYQQRIENLDQRRQRELQERQLALMEANAQAEQEQWAKDYLLNQQRVGYEGERLGLERTAQGPAIDLQRAQTGEYTSQTTARKQAMDWPKQKIPPFAQQYFPGVSTWEEAGITDPTQYINVTNAIRDREAEMQREQLRQAGETNKYDLEKNPLMTPATALQYYYQLLAQNRDPITNSEAANYMERNPTDPGGSPMDPNRALLGASNAHTERMLRIHTINQVAQIVAALQAKGLQVDPEAIAQSLSGQMQLPAYLSGGQSQDMDIYPYYRAHPEVFQNWYPTQSGMQFGKPPAPEVPVGGPRIQQNLFDMFQNTPGLQSLGATPPAQVAPQQPAAPMDNFSRQILEQLQRGKF